MPWDEIDCRFSVKNLAEHLLWFNYRQFWSVCGLADEAVSRREALPLGVDLPDLLHHFEQARAAVRGCRRLSA